SPCLHNHVGSKFGGGSVTGASDTNVGRRDLIDLPTNVNFDGKKHQTNLARRTASDAKDTQLMIAPTQSNVQHKVWEQKREPPTKAYQYLIVAAEPYETIAFRIPACEIEDEADEAGYWNWSYWDPDIN
ncbi:hypothetical protein DFJ58DRAFT_756843, partial [Suillus subalutaceus]|uniref:uncharacterized protein n=1 Tax=Suillus subalutaceus TaxID=48586 RepID=UPI001B875AB7